MNRLISFLSPSLSYSGVNIECGPCAGINNGVTAIVGPNGAGKSTLGLVLAKGRHCFNNRIIFHRPDLKVRILEFADIHSWAGIDVDYAAQRLEATMNEYVPTVATILAGRIGSPRWLELAQQLDLHHIENKKINYLSSGEQRKLLLVNALLDTPDILVIDNPYIGLDAETRQRLDHTLRQLTADRSLSVVMLLSDPADLPDFTDTLITMSRLRIETVITDPAAIDAHRHTVTRPVTLPPLPLPLDSTTHKPHNVTFAVENARLTYGGRHIIDNLDWQVNAGQRWALTGPNGSGKSLLVSVVCAESPQAYSNTIVQFDRPRGSGESIWEIKDRIGYVSPEMQVYFRSNMPVSHIVVQGARSMLNRFRPVTPHELDTAMRWLAILGIDSLADRRFSQLSAGQKRLVMLARVMLKQPDLMVLDEPFHGLDAHRKSLCRTIIHEIARRNNSSLIFVSHYESDFPPSITHRLTLPTATISTRLSN